MKSIHKPVKQEDASYEHTRSPDREMHLSPEQEYCKKKNIRPFPVVLSCLLILLLLPLTRTSLYFEFDVEVMDHEDHKTESHISKECKKEMKAYRICLKSSRRRFPPSMERFFSSTSWRISLTS